MMTTREALEICLTPLDKSTKRLEAISDLLRSKKNRDEDLLEYIDGEIQKAREARRIILHHVYDHVLVEKGREGKATMGNPYTIPSL